MNHKFINVHLGWVAVFLVLTGVFLNQQLLVAQEDNLNKKYYFADLKFHPYQEDMFANEVQDVNLVDSVFIANKDKDGRFKGVAFYQRRQDGTLKQKQYVNQDGQAYHYLNYVYASDSKLIKKEFIDEYQQVLAYYEYEYQPGTKNLIQKIQYVKLAGQAELKISKTIRFIWSEQELTHIESYNANKQRVETYMLNSGANLMNNLTQEAQNKAFIGNQLIPVIFLQRYERYNIKDQLSFYIVYKQQDAQILPSKYNGYDLLLEEQSPIVITQSQPSSLEEGVVNE